MTADVVIYVCQNSLAPETAARTLERAAQKAAGDLRVLFRAVPCSGKIDVPYLLKAFEGGARGVAVITCPLGGCRLAEGNLRAQVRAHHVRRLLGEVGLGGERFLLVHADSEAAGADVPEQVEQAAARIAAMPPSPLGEPAESQRTVAT